MNLITEEDSINGVNKMANWKAGGPDLHLYFRGTGLWNWQEFILNRKNTSKAVFAKEMLQSVCHVKNSVDTQGSSEGQSGWQLLPYCLYVYPWCGGIDSQ